MIAEAGLAALWLAAALSLLQFFARRGEPAAERRERSPARCGRWRWRRACSPRIAFLILIWLFLRTDLSVAAGRAEQPFGQALALQVRRRLGESRRLDAALGDGARASRARRWRLFERRLPKRTLIATLAAQAAIGLGFYAFLLFASNPFARLSPVPVEGNGLNPLLQDPGLAFHPPTLYFGYVGLSVAFSFAVGALITRDVGAGLRPGDAALGAGRVDLPDARHHRRQLLGLLRARLGRLVVLGPGRECLADAVAGGDRLAAHSVTVLATRDGLRAWTVMLAVVAFSMSMIGTFLVRSGILTSVHAFAVDPERGAFILALLALYIGGALALFGAAHRHGEGRLALRPGQPRGRAGGQQSAADRRSSASSSSARSIR